MTWHYSLAAAYLFLHFLGYVFPLREIPALRTEKAVFLYHFVSACVYSVLIIAVSVITLPLDEAVAFAAGAIFSHGIYSLSFLELWTLSQISYSREILALAEKRGAIPQNSPASELVQVGDMKKAGRLESLFRIKFLSGQDGVIRLAPRGRAIARTLRLMAWLANLKQTG